MKKTSLSLTPDQVKFLREINRANILLLLDKGKQAVEITDFLDVGRNTVSRTKQKFIRHGINAALQEEDRPGQPKRYKQKQEAEIIALTCSNAPPGRERWTLELLEKTARRKKGMKTISRESIRLILKKTNVNLG